MTVLNSVPLPTITVTAPVIPGDWFPSAMFRPFQPGIYEVSGVAVTALSSVRRFAFFDGVDFKPAATTPEEAQSLRMCNSYTQVHPITQFRGLSEEV